MIVITIVALEEWNETKKEKQDKWAVLGGCDPVVVKK